MYIYIYVCMYMSPVCTCPLPISNLHTNQVTRYIYIYIYMYIYIYIYILSNLRQPDIKDVYVSTCIFVYLKTDYGVATISRLLKIIDLFRKRAQSKRPYSANDILQTRPMIFRSLLIVATTYMRVPKTLTKDVGLTQPPPNIKIVYVLIFKFV